MKAVFFDVGDVITNGKRVGMVRFDEKANEVKVHFTHDEPRVVSVSELIGNDWLALTPLPTLKEKIHNELSQIRKSLEAVERDILALPEIAELIT